MQGNKKAKLSKGEVALVAMAAVFSVVTVALSVLPRNGNEGGFLGLLSLLTVLIFAVVHGLMRYGWKALLFFFVIVEIISNAIENLSIATGMPFGHYHYAPGVPFIFQVPFTIGLAYFAYGYLAWMVATIILDKADERFQSAYAVVLPLTAAFIMVMWDVVMDPVSSTIRHYWIWENGGGFNGVPLTNYLGWFITVYLFYQVFALYVRRKSNVVQKRFSSRLFWATPVVIYFVTGFSYVLMYMVAANGSVTDAVGQTWNTHSIYETAAIVSMFTMTFPAFLAAVKVARSDRP